MTKRGFIPESVNKPTVAPSVVNVPEIGELSRPPQTRPPMWVWVAVFVVALIALLVVMFRSGARTFGGGGMFFLPMMAVSMFMMMRNRGGGSDKTRPAAIRQNRVDFMRKLDELRDEVHAGARAQAIEVSYHHPAPTSLVTLVGTSRMWERGTADRNFGHVRLGTGLSRLQMTIEPPQKVPPAEVRETVTAMAARDFLLTQNVVHDVPRPLHLFDQPGWAFFADAEQREALQAVLRALVCQACVFHSPNALRVAIISDDVAAWEWAKWLPHVCDPDWVDASGPARMIFGDVDEAMAHLESDLAVRASWAPRMDGVALPDDWLLVVVDLPGGNCAPLLGASGRLGLSVLDATGDESSAVATAATSYVFDESGNLLRAQREGV